jgi:hypothetical protein
MHTLSFKQIFSLAFLLAAALLVAATLSAWTGPTATAPGGNVAAPVNVGTTDQVKDAGLSVNALTVFGSSYIQNKLGIEQTNPVVALDVNGSLKLGNGGELCQAVSEGAQRYNSSTKIMEYCNGTEWCPFAGCVHASPTPTIVFLTSGTSWTVPSNWNSSNNTVEVVGGGGGGAKSAGVSGGGGGGGAYSKVTNVTLAPGGTVSYAAGAGGARDGGTGGDTYFCNSTSNCASISGSAVRVGAKGGAGGSSTSGGAGGASGSGVGSTKYSGGNGADGSGSYAGGGAGAAGLHGDGNNAPSTGVMPGGAGDAGYGGAGGVGSSGGSGAQAGGAGTEWDSTHGSGGGGGGGYGGENPGGLYGAGGAGVGQAYSPGPTEHGGAGTQGLIVITYYATQ